jgi:hypothetical protein
MTNNTIDNVQKNVEGAVDNVVHTFDRKDTHSYKGWLNSDSFIKRAFAVFGYNTVASLIIMIPLYALLFIGALFFFRTLASGGDMQYGDQSQRQFRNFNNGDYQGESYSGGQNNSDYPQYNSDIQSDTSSSIR